MAGHVATVLRGYLTTVRGRRNWYDKRFPDVVRPTRRRVDPVSLETRYRVDPRTAPPMPHCPSPTAQAPFSLRCSTRREIIRPHWTGARPSFHNGGGPWEGRATG